MSMYGQAMTAMPTVADIAAVMNRGNNNGFGDGNGWWAIILMWALFGGYGGGWGFGGGMGRGQGVYDVDASIQRGFDNQTVLNKLNGLENGLCSIGYDNLAQTNGINTNIFQAAAGIQGSINQLGINNMQDRFALQTEIGNNRVAAMQDAWNLSKQQSDCCCEQRAAVQDLKYTMATDTCATNNNIHMTGDNIMQVMNTQYGALSRQIDDKFCQLEMNQMRRENQDLRDQLNRCDRDAALRDQSTYLTNILSPRPEPAYLVQNPNCCQPITLQLQNSGCNSCNQNRCCNNNQNLVYSNGAYAFVN